MSTFLKSNEPRNIHDPIAQLDHDILDRQELAQTILERLIKYDIPVLGIYGGWGTGKTSLLNLLYQLNENQVLQSQEKELHIKIIDAWKYEGGESLLVPIVVCLKKMVGEGELPDSWKVVTRRVLITTALSVTDALLKKFTEVDRKSIKENYEEVEMRDRYDDHCCVLAEWEHWSDEIENTEKAFKRIVNLALERIGCKRIIVCIDNLDRCSPESAVRLLESVKIFFSVPRFTWVFAMDSEVIASYINHKYEGTRVDGNSYLDKIIPEQYHLSFIPDECDSRIFELIRCVTERDLTLNEQKRLPLIPYVMVPRRLKKSAIKYIECFSDEDPPDAESDTVFLLSLLYHTWPEFYARLSSNAEEHIGRLLANFFKVKTTDKWGDYLSLPLDKKFVEEQDLIQFLHTAFPEARNRPSDVVRDIQRAMSALRRVGLP